MKILVIGGTQFIGRHVVEKLLAANHDVTLLNRGKSAPQNKLPVIKADRESDLQNITELKQSWDAVIDLSAYYPKDVAHILDVLKGHAGRYIFCSTISAYAELNKADVATVLREDSVLHECTPEQAVDRTMTTYGQRKAECERLAMKQHQDGVPVVVIRPSIVYGAFDYTDRFAYWIWRAFQQRPFILPENGITITQRTYAPDLATAFVTALTSNSALGQAYNIAETETLNLRDTIQSLGNHLEKQPLDFAIPKTLDWLQTNDIKPWADLPLWIPGSNLLIDTERSRRDLSFTATPIHKAIGTSADAFLLENREPKAGLPFAKESDLLAR